MSICRQLLLHGAPQLPADGRSIAADLSARVAVTLPSGVMRPLSCIFSREGHSRAALTGADFQHAVGGEARALQLLRGVVEERHQQDDLARQVRQRGSIPARLLPRLFTHFICACPRMTHRAHRKPLPFAKKKKKTQFTEHKVHADTKVSAGCLLKMLVCFTLVYRKPTGASKAHNELAGSRLVQGRAAAHHLVLVVQHHQAAGRQRGLRRAQHRHEALLQQRLVPRLRAHQFEDITHSVCIHTCSEG